MQELVTGKRVLASFYDYLVAVSMYHRDGAVPVRRLWWLPVDILLLIEFLPDLEAKVAKRAPLSTKVCKTQQS